VKTITVEFAPDGSVSIDAAGFKGGECLKETADLERALGAVRSRTEKPELRLGVAKTKQAANQGR